MPDTGYEGADNLEVLAGAVHYNRFLVEAVVRASRGATSAVDFGAGLGTLAAALAGRGLEVVCVEPDSGLREALLARGLRALGDLEAVPDGSRQFIYAINVLEHIEDDLGAVMRLRAKLRPGGRLFLYVPAFGVLFSSMDRKVGHRRRYTRSGVLQLAHRSKLAVETIRYADSLGFFATLLYKWFGNPRGDLSPAAVRLFDRVLFPCSLELDRVGFSRLFGKNLLAVLRNPDPADPPATRSPGS